jgi:low temperature requirement protein LtrA
LYLLVLSLAQYLPVYLHIPRAKGSSLFWIVVHSLTAVGMLISVFVPDSGFVVILAVSLLIEFCGPVTAVLPSLYSPLSLTHAFWQFIITFAFPRHRLPLHIEHFTERNGLLVRSLWVLVLKTHFCTRS